MASPEFNRFKKLLKDNHYFVTRPRMRLFAVLQKHPTLTLKQLIRLAPKHNQVTVYRNVTLFEKLGIINKLWLGWQTKIELSDIFQHHHHHLACASCGRVWTLAEDALIENRIKKMAVVKSFKPIDHQLEIRGICRHCQSR